MTAGKMQRLYDELSFFLLIRVISAIRVSPKARNFL